MPYGVKTTHVSKAVIVRPTGVYAIKAKTFACYVFIVYCSLQQKDIGL